MTVRNTDPVTPLGAVHVGPEGLAGLVDAALDGLALLDDQGAYAHVNPAGCRILGAAADDLLGRHAVFSATTVDHGPGPVPSTAGDATRIALWRLPATASERELEYRTTLVDTAGRRATAVAFRDVTQVRLQQRRSTAFATAAANVAHSGSLRATLDAICGEVVRTTDLAAAQILLMNTDGLRMRVHGAAPPEAWPEEFVLLLEEARRRGARLSSLEAFRTRRPVVHRRRKERLLADVAWKPLHDQFEGFDWESFASVPLLVHEAPVGALNAYYRPGHDPDGDEVAFLASMADHAAVAVENARLLVDSQGKAALDERHRLARELHDSACQQLFSMTLHIRAAEVALPRDRPADRATRHSLRTIDGLAHAALDDMRALIFELYPTLLHTEGLVAVVRQEATSAASRTGLEVEVEAPDERLNLDSDVELDAHRLVQEALHNCVKHAGAASVRIRIGPDPGDGATLLIEVADDGRGFDPVTSTTGLGLVSMRERAERLGGELTITPSTEAGTVVRAVVPRVLHRDGRRSGRDEP